MHCVCVCVCVGGGGWEGNIAEVDSYPDGLVESSDAGVQGMNPALTLLKVLGYRGNEQ